MIKIFLLVFIFIDNDNYDDQLYMLNKLTEFENIIKTEITPLNDIYKDRKDILEFIVDIKRLTKAG